MINQNFTKENQIKQTLPLEENLFKQEMLLFYFREKIEEEESLS